MNFVRSCLTAMTSLTAMFLLFSCKKEYEQANDLLLDKSEIILAADSSVSISITQGNGEYQVVSSNVEIAATSIVQDKIIIKAVPNVANAEVVIVVTDRYYKRASIHVRIIKHVNFSLNKDSVIISQQQGRDSMYITGGLGNFVVTSSNPYIAKTIVHDSLIEIIGMKSGNTTLTIKDRLGHTKEILVKVRGEDYAFAFGKAYFGWADFKAIAQVDPSIRTNKQITLELTCKLSGYRGLQTFMGLENNLIFRGKNDDYQPTHPIEIAGLHDSIVLQSTSSFNLNQWMNIALVVDCDQVDVLNKYKLYINGKQDFLLIQRNNGTHKVVNLASSGDNNLFEIARAAGQDFRAMQGVVSEARVWTVARTSNQIKSNMCNLIETNPTGLLAYWKFSSGINTNYIQDVSGGKYETNLILASINSSGYGQVYAPSNLFVQRGCPQ